MIKMSDTIYRYDWEYAVKFTRPVNEDTKNQVEIYDRYAWNMLDVNSMTVDNICDILSEVWWKWRSITEDEYNKIVSKKED